MLLSAAALVSAVLGFASFILTGSIPLEIAAAIRPIATVMPPTLLAIATMLLPPRSPSSARSRFLVVALVAASATASVLFTASFSAGMDDGDAGRPIGFFGGLTWWFALVGVVIAGSAVAWPMRVLFDGISRVLAVAIGAFAAVPLFFALLNPSVTALASSIVLGSLLAQSVRSAGKGRSSAARRPGDAVSRAHRMTRAMGILSIAILGVVWGVAAAVGVSESGLPAATVAMGYGLALAPVAALPLVLALANRSSRGLRRFAAIPVAGIIAGAVVQVVAYSLNGTGIFSGSAVAGLAIGVWFAVALLPRTELPSAVRIFIATAIIAGSATAWFLLVTTSGGISLVAPAIVAIAIGRAPSTPAGHVTPEGAPSPAA